ncbi:hypothetical protein QBC44DRAFT_321673 [Cladorrhinum sp. PSN332]|nr:hypothetical protein QBC44DRAFT_321673 [Cladorrhinum sp. PSN332]
MILGREGKGREGVWVMDIIATLIFASSFALCSCISFAFFAGQMMFLAFFFFGFLSVNSDWAFGFRGFFICDFFFCWEFGRHF